VVPESELSESFSTSSGPGGQHANKASTRVTLAWNVDRSNVLSDNQRDRLKKSLGNRIDSSGFLRVSSDQHRSQHRNRQDVYERMGRIVGRGLQVRRPRRATAPSAAARQKRLDEKKRRSDTKRLRRDPWQGH
jgi:ribosome-associated protein